MFSLPAITQLLTRRKPWESVAVRRTELYPATESQAPPAIYMPDTLGRVTGLWTPGFDAHTWQIELDRIRGGKVQHCAVQDLEFENVQLHEGFLYAGGSKFQLEPHSQSLKPMSRHAPVLEHASLACTLFGNRYFGHFLVDDLPLTQLAQGFAPPIRSAQPLSAHSQAFCDKLGLHATLYRSAHIKKLHTFVDHGQGPYKKERFEAFRRTLLEGVAPSGYRGAMMLRGTSGVLRKMVNEREFANVLAGLGFVILDPLRMQLDEIIRALCGVEVVVGVEGSQLLFAPWTMAHNGTLIVLQPPYRFNNINKNYTDCLGQKYGFVIGQPQDDGFVVDPGEFKALLDRVTR